MYTKTELRENKIGADEITLMKAATGFKGQYFRHEGVQFKVDANFIKNFEAGDIMDIRLSTEAAKAWSVDDDQTVENAQPTGKDYTRGVIDGYSLWSQAITRAEKKGNLKAIEAKYSLSPAQQAAAKAAADLV